MQIWYAGCIDARTRAATPGEPLGSRGRQIYMYTYTHMYVYTYTYVCRWVQSRRRRPRGGASISRSVHSPSGSGGDHLLSFSASRRLESPGAFRTPFLLRFRSRNSPLKFIPVPRRSSFPTAPAPRALSRALRTKSVSLVGEL